MELQEKFEILKPKHSLDVAQSESLRRRLEAAIQKQKQGVVLDFSEVDMIDSAGLGILVQGMKKLRKRSGRFVLVNLNPNIQHIFQITRLYKHFDIYRNWEDFHREEVRCGQKAK